MKYDELLFYTTKFQHVFKAKAIDILAIEPNGCCWLIEVKDYRTGHQTSAVKLAEVIAQKARDSLAGLATARVRATGQEQRIAESSMTSSDLRVVLHMENPSVISALFTKTIDPADVQAALRPLVKSIDSRFQVVDSQTSVHLPWTVQ